VRRIEFWLICCLFLLVGALSQQYFSYRVNAAAAAPPSRKYYITKSTVMGNGALTACSTGYHMASLFEILDVSSLQYDTTLGLTSPDSGSGPPTGLPTGYPVHGWIRTGSVGLPTNQNANFGSSSCSAWTSSAANDHGSVVFLIANGSADSHTVAPVWWYELGGPPSQPPACNQQRRVWCVQD
jgi:hypothetical protein